MTNTQLSVVSGALHDQHTACVGYVELLHDQTACAGHVSGALHDQHTAVC